jgi:hypothetical protein
MTVANAAATSAATPVKPTTYNPVRTASGRGIAGLGSAIKLLLSPDVPSLAHRTIDVRLQRARSLRRMETSST